MEYWLLLVVVVVLVFIEIRKEARVRHLFDLTPHLIFQEAIIPSTGITDTSHIRAIKIYTNRSDISLQRAKEVLITGRDEMVCGRSGEDGAVVYGIAADKGYIVRYMESPIANLAEI